MGDLSERRYARSGMPDLVNNFSPTTSVQRQLSKEFLDLNPVIFRHMHYSIRSAWTLSSIRLSFLRKYCRLASSRRLFSPSAREAPFPRM